MFSDYVRNIESKIIKEFCKIVKFMIIRMILYYFEGLVEGFN